MANIIPDSWKHALADLRDDIQQAIRRWLPTRDTHGVDTSTLPVKIEPAIDQLRDDLHTTLERWLPSWQRETDWDAGDRLPSVFIQTGPHIDMEETDDAVIVSAEIPGLEKKGLSVEVTAQRLVLRGEKRSTSEHKQHGYAYSERMYGAFARAMPLPCEVEADNAQAKYRHGVLRITLPKTERAKATRVPVRAA